MVPTMTLALSACGASEATVQGNQSSVAHRRPGETPGPWQPAAGLRRIHVRPGEAPDGTFRRQPSESVQTYDDPAAVGGKS